MALVLAALASAGLAIADTSQAESSAWFITERLRTAEAYERFLARYPDSPFAPRARSALLKYRQLDESSATRRLNRLANIPGLRDLSSGRLSEHLPYPLGTRLLGPGVTTTRSLLLKQHILIPLGEWIPIASIDRRVIMPQIDQITTIAFAKFDNQSLEELMLVTLPTVYSLSPRSGDIPVVIASSPLAECTSQAQASDFWHADSGMHNSWCTTVRTQFSMRLELQGTDAATLTKPAVDLLAVEVPNFTHRADTHVTSKSIPFMSYAHFYRHSKSRVLLVDNVEDGDVSLPPHLDPAARAHYRQQAHFAYQAALTLNRNYGDLVLAPETRLPGGKIFSVLGRVP